ncbi:MULTISPECIES: GGDEF domain-containing response regulator [Desulfobacula]|uniref:diguanylate cyclase n=2 Tax=Desulfobacula TaxID=28222 RepID=K0NKV5_DESTT|nr:MULTISPECIES: diguanylate cyclase [Desulfobacula]CCK81415.1 two component system response regulator modulated with diguanylate cyclase [Desulfobacula toluolica Tol2]SDU28529.1 diguanylate cyclase (GGDEF) domain-containing protein [Desulfobacula phenolica]
MHNNRKSLPKILIVDDNKQNVELLVSLFEQEFRVVPATSGERALKIATSKNPPDIILTDIMMPEIDGYQLCTSLKNNPETRHIPVLFVTAISEVMDATKGFEAGAVDYITKPFHPPMVLARVNLHLAYQRKQKLLEDFAFIDALTEIPNRRRFDQVFENEVLRACRSSQSISLLFMDIDFFKKYNDTYGHGKGDSALRQVALMLQSTLKRAGDFVARYGGEEFVAVLPYADENEAFDISVKIRDAIATLKIPHKTSEVSPYITLSYGLISILPDMKIGLELIVEAADRALYEAKRTGRNKICRGKI